jgi:hypothetical protein
MRRRRQITCSRSEASNFWPRREYRKKLPRRSGEVFSRLTPADYGFGVEPVVVVVELLVPGEELVLTVVFDSVLLDAAGDSFTTVVLFSVLFSPGGLVTVVSFF